MYNDPLKNQTTLEKCMLVLDTWIKPGLINDGSVIRSVEMELARAKRAHHRVEDAELQRCQSPDHDAPGAQSLRAELDNARLLRDVHHALWDGPVTASAGLVHLREQRIRGVRNDRGDNTGNRTAAQAHARVVDLAAITRLAVHAPVPPVRDHALHSELR